MSRLPRIVLPGVPHHVTQRGNRRERTFFEDGDYALYLDLLADAAHKASTEIWSYCLMPNHVHTILVPQDADGLRRTFGDLHRRYTGYINARMRTTGHLWQGRFASAAMDEAHLVTAFRYVALNPVRARLARRATDWPWSSSRALCEGVDDGASPWRRDSDHRNTPLPRLAPDRRPLFRPSRVLSVLKPPRYSVLRRRG